MNENQINNPFSKIPHMDKLLNNEVIKECNVYHHEIVSAIRTVLADIREALSSGKTEAVPDEDEIVKEAVDLVNRHVNRHIHKVINGTGVVLHSNFGRACLSEAAAKAAYDAARTYSTLEYNAQKGERGSRTAVIEAYLAEITGCEASLIVNNNAAAMLLILTTIAKGGNVVVSRGELVEIGGGFRVPDIITSCGAVLRTVGATNKTRLKDYRNAINKNTKALLKVHTSNYRIMGFSETVEIKELVKLGKSKSHGIKGKSNIPVIEDIGSGALIELNEFGIHDEPFVRHSLEAGADIVSFSGDKLLGGPQCGIILGKAKYIRKMKKHPLYRALRADKMTLASLEATLRVCVDPKDARAEIPTLKMIALTADELSARAYRLRDAITRHGGSAEVLDVKSVAGCGAVPGLELCSYAVSPIAPLSASQMQRHLRELATPIVGRIENDRLLLDVRTMFEEDFDYIASEAARMC